MRPATTIELHDVGIIYTTDKNFDAHFGKVEKIFTVYGNGFVGLASLFGVEEVSPDTVLYSYPKSIYIEGSGPAYAGDVQVQAKDIEFSICRGEPFKAVVVDLEAQVDGPNLVTFQLKWETGDWKKFTHSGRFTVHWGEWDS